MVLPIGSDAGSVGHAADAASIGIDRRPSTWVSTQVDRTNAIVQVPKVNSITDHIDATFVCVC